MKFALSISSFILVVLLSGCSDDNVDIVKNSFMQKYPHTTIGKAFDGTFKGGKWESKESDKGTIHVIFTGKIPNDSHDKAVRLYLGSSVDEFIDRIKDEDPYRIGNILYNKGLSKYEKVSNEQRAILRAIENDCYNRTGHTHPDEQAKAVLAKAEPEARRAILQAARDEIASECWPIGGEVTFVWKVTADKASCSVSSFEVKSPVKSLDYALMVIYSE